MMRVSTCAALVALLLIGGGSESRMSAQAPAAPPAVPPASEKKPVQQAPATAPKPVPAPTTAKPAAPVVPAQAPLPDDYVIGPDDILHINFWREKDLTGDVTVRPDGKISIPLLQDVDAAGLTPMQLRDKINAQAQKFVEDPNATVVVKEINSRKVFITGQISKPGPYRLMSATTVVQLIAVAGGLLEYADQENIAIVRVENGAPVSYRLNYKEIAERRNLKQNIMLKPGDTVLVP